jgi:predicted esterase
MARAYSISIPRTARFFTQGGEGGDPQEVWFVLHGYGQLAEGFLFEFDDITSDDRRIVAPEGLSRFYLKNADGPVGASWMTKAGREEEIADYVRFLDSVYAHLFGNLKPDARVHVLGFSQGAATALRWAALGVSRIDRLILWAGGTAPDIDLVARRSRLEKISLTLVVGTRDGYIDETSLKRETDRLVRASLPHRVVRFDGGHRLDSETLSRLAETS